MLTDDDKKEIERVASVTAKDTIAFLLDLRRQISLELTQGNLEVITKATIASLKEVVRVLSLPQTEQQ